MGGGGGASRNDSVINNKYFTFTDSGNLNLSNMFAFNYKSGGGIDSSRGDLSVKATNETYNSLDQRSQGGKGGDSSVSLGLGFDLGGAGSGLGGLSGGLSDGGLGSSSGGSSGGGSGSASASNSGYSPTEMNGSGSTFTITKGFDLNNKWLIGCGIAVGLAYIIANRKK